MNPDDRAIKNADSTDYPVFIIVSGKNGKYHAGPWFTRAAAERHLRAKAHDFPKSAYVYTASGHMSADYRHLCETGELP